MIVAGKEQFQRLSCLGIPESDRPVFAARREMLPVRGEHNGPDIMGMSAKRSEQPPGFDVPYPHVSIHPAAGEGQSVRRIGDSPDTVRMSAEGLDLSYAGFPMF